MDSDDDAFMEPLRTSPRIAKTNPGKKKLPQGVEDESSFAHRANKKRRTGNIGQSMVGVSKQNVGFKCSPHLMHLLFQRLNDNQRIWVQELGFGMLLTMPSCVLPKGLTVWLVNQVCWKKRSLVVGGRSIQIKNVMKKILGIPDGLHPVPFPRCKRGKSKGNKYGVEEREFKGGKAGRGVSYKTTFDCLIASSDPVQFKRAFMLYVLCIYFAPSSGLFINRSYASIINDVDLIKDMNWCDHVADVLIEGVCEYRESKAVNVNVHGCVHVLLLIYIDIVKSAFIKVPNGTPRALYVNSVNLELLDYHDLKFTTHEGPEYGKLEVDHRNEPFSSNGDVSPPIIPSPNKTKAGTSSSTDAQDSHKYVKECITKIDSEYPVARDRAYEECFKLLRKKITKIDTIRSCAISELHEKWFKGGTLPSPSSGRVTSSVSRQSATIATKKNRNAAVKPLDCLLSTPRKQISLTKSVPSLCTLSAEKCEENNSNIFSSELSFRLKRPNPAQHKKLLLSEVHTSTSSPSTPALGYYVYPPSVELSPKSLDLQQNCRQFSTYVLISQGSKIVWTSQFNNITTLLQDQYTSAVDPRDPFDCNDPLGFHVMKEVAEMGKECEGQVLMDAHNDGVCNPDPAIEAPLTNQKYAPSPNDQVNEELTDMLVHIDHPCDHSITLNAAPCSQTERAHLNTIIEDNETVLPQEGSDPATDFTFTPEPSRATSPCSDATVVSPDLYWKDERAHGQIGTAGISPDPSLSINKDEEMQPSNSNHSGRARDSGLPSFSSQDVFDRLGGAPASLGRLDMVAVSKQDDDAVYLKVSMPGLGKEHVKVWAEKNSVMITGEGEKEPWDDGDASAAAVPKYSGRVEMPAGAFKMDKIKAEMKNGVLRVTVPKLKREEHKDVFQVQVE